MYNYCNIHYIVHNKNKFTSDTFLFTFINMSLGAVC